MSTFLMMGMVTCLFAATSTFLIGIFHRAPLVDEYDARPKHHPKSVKRAASSKPHRANPSPTKRSGRYQAGVRILTETGHQRLPRRAAAPLSR